jgi:hypothetical protein
LGIDYARTVGDTYNFEIPTNYLSWFPTMHQFAKAYWEPNQPEKDKQELIDEGISGDRLDAEVARLMS